MSEQKPVQTTKRERRVIPWLTAIVFLFLFGFWWKQSSSVEDTRDRAITKDATLFVGVRGESSEESSIQDPLLAVQEELPMPNCWHGLLALDKHGSLQDIRAALARAAAAGDGLFVSYLQESLAERVGGNVEAALEVIAWAEKSGQPALLLDALKNTAAIQDPRISEKLLEIGENGTQSFDLRQAALGALDTQKHLDPRAIGRMKALALDENADELAWMATRSLGHVMKQDFAQSGNFEPYWNELLDIGEHSSETAVRLLALEMPSYSEPLIGGSSLDSLGEILRTDEDPRVREMAAFRLGLTKEPGKALQIFEGAFGKEKDICVRWAIFRFAVRAAGAKALPLLERLAALEPRLLPDYEDFKRLYASGTKDFSRIWLGKTEHLQCLEQAG